MIIAAVKNETVGCVLMFRVHVIEKSSTSKIKSQINPLLNYFVGKLISWIIKVNES